MPFVNGVFVPEDQLQDAGDIQTNGVQTQQPSADVSTRVSDLISADSPFIQRAKTEAKQAANRRGLLNTSIAVQAGEAAAQKAALPIAAQEASQAHETAQSIAQRTFEASESGLERTARRGLLGTELESRENVALAQRELIEREGIATREAQQFSDEQRIEADRILTEMGILSNEFLTQLNADTRVLVANLSAQSQEAIAALNVQSSERQKATEAFVNVAAQYESAFAALAGNTSIPSSYRDAANRHLIFVRDSGFELIEQLYNIDLNWQTLPTNEPSQGLLTP